MHKISLVFTIFLFCMTAFAQIPTFTVSKSTKIYHEPLTYSAIIAVAEPDLDSLQCYKITTQNNIDFAKVSLIRTTTITKRNGSKEESKSVLYGFVALYDLDESVAAALRRKLTAESFALCRLIAQDTSESKEPKKMAIISYAKRKILGSTTANQLFLLSNKTRCLQLRDEENEYLRSVIKHFKPNPDNIYTIQVQLKKPNFINWIFGRSKCTIDSISETKKFADRQVIRRRDSCIAWYHDRSNAPMIWSGGCKDGYANGDGMLQLDTNRLFVGRLEMGMMQGEGTLRDNAWEIKGGWNDGQLTDLRQVHTVLFYKNKLPARDTTQHRLYPTRAPITEWYKERNTRLNSKIQPFKAFRRNDITFQYLKESFNLVLPDNENPLLRKFKPADCAAIHHWKSAGAERVSYNLGDAPFFHIRCKDHQNQEHPDGRVYYSATDNKWYWWGAFYTDGPYPTFQDALRDVCKCR